VLVEGGQQRTESHATFLQTLAIVLLVTLKGHSSGGLVLVLLGGILAAAGGAIAPRR
jgi:hypothetical protein